MSNGTDDPFRDVGADTDATASVTGFDSTQRVFDELLTRELPDAAEASRSVLEVPSADVAGAGGGTASIDDATAMAVENMPIVSVPNPGTSPWWAIPYVTLLGGDGKWYSASAFIIGRHHLATAGHVVRFRDMAGPVRIRVYPGRSGGSAVMALDAVDFAASAAWRQNGDLARDYGVIRVAEDLSQFDRFLPTALPGNAPRINVAGYPSGDPAGRMWGAQTRVHKESTHRFGYPVDTKKGQSGGAVWLPNTMNAVGIHVRFEEFAIAVRLTQAVFNDMMTLV